MIVIPNVAALGDLQDLINTWDPYVHLYVTDIPLDLDTVKEDFEELDVGSYAPIALSGWSDPEIVAGRAQTETEVVTWTWSSGDSVQEVFGYFVTSGLDGRLLWCQRGESPPYLVGAGQAPLRILPRYSLRGEVRMLHQGL